jgi:hypothetical protein
MLGENRLEMVENALRENDTREEVKNGHCHELSTLRSSRRTPC